jgi:hypothetical protein
VVFVSEASEILLENAIREYRTRWKAHCDNDVITTSLGIWLGLHENCEDAAIALETGAKKKRGAQRSYKDVAAAGFLAASEHKTNESEPQFRRDIAWLIHRQVSFEGVPTGVTVDGVAILGLVLGTSSIGDVNITRDVVAWASNFLPSSVKQVGIPLWQKFLMGTAASSLGIPDATVPYDAEIADVFIALTSKNVITGVSSSLVETAAEHSLSLLRHVGTNQDDIDRLGLALAAYEWLARRQFTERKTASIGSSNHPKVVFPLHGIRTRAEWVRSFTQDAQIRGWICREDSWNFGRFSLLQFLLPWGRKAKQKWFEHTYANEMQVGHLKLDEDHLPSIIAHSFGCYLLGYSMLKYEQLRFNKIILCGSILPRDFHWDDLLERGQVRAVRNEFGVKDHWVKLVRFFVRGSGDSGAKGFLFGHPRLYQREFVFNHSDFFARSHMQSWLAFLELEEAVPPPTPEVIVRWPKPRPPIMLYGIIAMVCLIASGGIIYTTTNWRAVLPVVAAPFASPTASSNPRATSPPNRTIESRELPRNNAEPTDVQHTQQPVGTLRHQTIQGSRFGLRLARVAEEQFERYHDKQEGDPALADQIRKYWEAIHQDFPGVATPWSAVFVSYCVKQAGASEVDFKGSALNADFVRDAVKNSWEDKGLFRAFHISGQQVHIGDIIQYSRNTNLIRFEDLGRPGGYESSTVIVILTGEDDLGKCAVVVGGNQGNSIRESIVRLTTDGMIQQRSANPFICIVRNVGP